MVAAQCLSAPRPLQGLPIFYTVEFRDYLLLRLGSISKIFNPGVRTRLVFR